MAGLVSRFQYEESNYMVAEAMEGYALASAEASYEDLGNRRQRDSGWQEEDFMMKMLLTGDITTSLPLISQPDFLREN